jgi:hypothetical protein
MNQLKTAISEIAKSKDLKNISLDIVEKLLDCQITEELLKEIPVMKFLVSARNIYSSYSDRIFIKKAMVVLLEIGDMNIEDRKKFLMELDDKDVSGSEKVLMAINHLESIEKSKIFGRLCRLRILRKIDTDGFYRLTKLIQDAYIQDLNLIVDFKKIEGDEIYEEEYLSLITLGLIYQVPSEQEPLKYYPEGANEYGTFGPEVTGGKITFNYYLSDTGKLLLENYNELIS